MSDKSHKHIGHPLDRLSEECAEVIQQISKIRRFGLSDVHLRKPEAGTNQQRLLDEINDVELEIKQVRALIEKGELTA